jgi:hypothetical protein
MLPWIIGITLFLFQFRIQILTHSRAKLSCYGFSYGPNTHDAVGRVPDMVATAASSWILAATASSWILATTASNRPSRPEFQHSSPTFQPGILAVTTVSTSSWRASPVVGNASVDDIDAAAAVTFFFATDDKSFVPTFNCSICNTSKCRISRLLIHLCLQASFFVGQTRLR